MHHSPKQCSWPPGTTAGLRGQVKAIAPTNTIATVTVAPISQDRVLNGRILGGAARPMSIWRQALRVEGESRRSAGRTHMEET